MDTDRREVGTVGVFSRAAVKYKKLEPGSTLGNVSCCFMGGRAGQSPQGGHQLSSTPEAQGAHDLGPGRSPERVPREGGREGPAA